MALRLVHLLHLRTRKNTCFSSAPFLEPPVFLCLDYLRKVTLTLETITTIFELHQSFLLCPLPSEGERMRGISLDRGERERQKKGRQMMD